VILEEILFLEGVTPQIRIRYLEIFFGLGVSYSQDCVERILHKARVLQSSLGNEGIKAAIGKVLDKENGKLGEKACFRGKDIQAQTILDELFF